MDCGVTFLVLQPSGLVKAHMKMPKTNMGKIVMSVIIKLLEYSARAFLLIYALIGLTGIMWFSNTIKIPMLIQGVVFVCVATFIGLEVAPEI